MPDNNFYITTPIYYVNDKPHIGHAYTTVLADTLARYHRLLGDDTYFLTGTDEHGQKVQKAADQRHMTPQEQCDTTVVRFQELWKKLEITNDDFIRTTEPRHKKIVQAILQDLFDRGQIYKAEYEGHYCVPCERFFTAKDLAEGNPCPDCGRPMDTILEANYFFKMGQYQQWLIDYIKDNPDFIQPPFRANETLGFLRQPLGDLCVSRPKSRLAWGIELPFDPDYVCYVWFDALVNYISAVGYLSDDAKFQKRWPASYHLIGKDILTTHSVYWPTMLKAMGLPMPKTIFAHGWWLIGSSKMSKSVGNVVNPMDLAERYGVDAFRYFLIAEMTLGQDTSFTEESFVARYNTELANDLGNLLNRVLKFALSHGGAAIPSPTAPYGDEEKELQKHVLDAVTEMRSAVLSMQLNRGLEAVMAAVRAGNRYIERRAPWKLAKEGKADELATVIYSAAEALRILSGLLLPVMPEKAKTMRMSLGFAETEAATADIAELGQWGKLVPGTKIVDPGVLFPRIDTKAAAAVVPPPETKPVPAAPPVEGVALIGVDDFFKAKLKTAKVLEAEKVPKADKLLRLQIDLGAERRQIVAGIALFYKPEEVVGKTIVVVSNLKPALIRGLESNGMLLAAKDDKQLRLITVDGDLPPGLSVG